MLIINLILVLLIAYLLKQIRRLKYEKMYFEQKYKILKKWTNESKSNNSVNIDQPNFGKFAKGNQSTNI